MIQLTVNQLSDLLIGNKQYATLSKREIYYQSIMAEPSEERQGIVLENDPWTQDMGCHELGSLTNDLVRLWHRKDWELCDNRRRTAIHRIEEQQKARKARYQAMRNIAVEYMAAGMVAQLGKEMATTMATMAISANTDEQVAEFYATIVSLDPTKAIKEA